MRGEYFYSLIGGVVSGVLAGSLMLVPAPAVAWVLLLGVMLGLIPLRQRLARQVSIPLALSVFLVGAALALVRWDIVPPLHHPTIDTQVGQEVTLTGDVVREADERERTTHLYIDTGETRVLVFASRFTDAGYGDEVTVTGVIDHPESFTTDFGRTFNYPGYLAARGVGYTMRFAQVEVISSGNGNVVMSSLLSFKQRFLWSIEQVIPEPQSGLAAGLLLGVKQALGEQNEDAFRAVGLTHIVVLSGYNVMLVVAFFMFVLAFVLPFRLRLVVGLVGIAGFALLVGLSATVVRASIMASLLLLVRVAGGTHNLLRALALAAAIMLLINPYLLLYDVGFQLSFVATLALILTVTAMERWFGWLPSTFGLREFAAATVTTQLFVAPLLLYQIGEVSLVAVAANLLVLPMVPVAMLLAFLTGLIGLVSSTLALPVGYAAHLSLGYILAVATTLAATPLATVTVPAFHWTVLLVSYALLIAAAWWVFRRLDTTTLPAGVPSEIDVSGWTIEEEEESKVAGERSSPATKPVFFR